MVYKPKGFAPTGILECWNNGSLGSRKMQCWVNGKMRVENKIKKGKDPFKKSKIRYPKSEIEKCLQDSTES